MKIDHIENLISMLENEGYSRQHPTIIDAIEANKNITKYCEKYTNEIRHFCEHGQDMCNTNTKEKNENNNHRKDTD